MLPSSIATEVVQWQIEHGRNHLPWQQTRDPYRVWLSEIMLQQTQVATVLGYYERFLGKFPDVAALAAATQDEVLALWSGLGYYTRARNLHKCAQEVVQKWQGRFPGSAQELETLPGIGRSTAGAIAAFCFSERVPILDANVRRVLTRVLGFDGDLANARNERLLWDHAQQLCPEDDLATSMPRYTQGMMDLGASVCLAQNPSCLVCPLQRQCVAARQGNPRDYPVRTRKLKRSAEAWWLLLATDVRQRVQLQRRPATGIWAGLYSPPVFESLEQLQAFAQTQWPVSDSRRWTHLDAFTHVLTHKDLHLHPVLVPTDQPMPPGVAEPGQTLWADAAMVSTLGLPAPIRKLLEQHFASI